MFAFKSLRRCRLLSVFVYFVPIKALSADGSKQHFDALPSTVGLRCVSRAFSLIAISTPNAVCALPRFVWFRSASAYLVNLKLDLSPKIKKCSGSSRRDFIADVISATTRTYRTHAMATVSRSWPLPRTIFRFIPKRGKFISVFPTARHRTPRKCYLLVTQIVIRFYFRSQNCRWFALHHS